MSLLKKLFFIILFVTPAIAFSQSKWSIYAGIGGMYYQGDLKETAIPDFRTLKLCYGGGVHFQASPLLGFDLNYLRGKLEGDDKYALSASKRNRNLRFLTKIDDISLRVTFNFLREYPYRFVPYAIAGAGAFHFNPMRDGVALQPIGTEGQGIPGYPAPYSLWQVGFPLGLGVKYQFGCRFGVKLEAVYHKLLTDYLDDVSDKYPDPAVLSASAAYLSDPNIVPDNRVYRGNPAFKDSWIDLNLSLIVYLGRCGLDNDRMLEDCEDLYKDLHDTPQ